MKQKRDRYEMHKYWGKKPAAPLGALLEQYTRPGDVVLDVFSGYGVFCFEAYSMGRNVISNDLNPMAHFIQRQVFRDDLNWSRLEHAYQAIIKGMEDIIDEWFGFDHEGQRHIATTVLRDHHDQILTCKYNPTQRRGTHTYAYSSREARAFREREEEHEIADWFPRDNLWVNSRINAKPHMSIADLFTTRTLACHARLLALINDHAVGPERDLLLLAFTSNLANCSKLVPPIRSRGPMAAGAWMTGFYVGATYLENNVLHYFKNRYHKVVRGKRDTHASLHQGSTHALPHEGAARDVTELVSTACRYLLMNEDARCLPLESESVDYIFTDPPYGDSVPYFEQSVIWNAWLSFAVNYQSEIVVSDSKLRAKTIDAYADDLDQALAEIARVLKPEGHLSLTFHSLSGAEWRCLTNACIKAGFILCEFEWLTQKTFSPRQLSRRKTVKGDVLLTFTRATHIEPPKSLSVEQTHAMYEDVISREIEAGTNDTNGILMAVVREIYSRRVLLADLNFFHVLCARYELVRQGETYVWRSRDHPRS